MNDSLAVSTPIPAIPTPSPRPAEPLVKRTLKWMDVALILLIFLLLEAVIAPGFAHGLYDIANRAGPGMARYPLPVLIQIVAQEGPILLLIFWFAVLRGLSPGDLGFRKAPLYWLLVGVALLVILLPVRLCAGLAAHFATGGTLDNIAGLDDGRSFPILASPAIAGLPTVFMVGVIAPLVEELIFRAILYVWLRQQIGVAWAVALSSLIFGLVHPNIAMGVSAVVMGVALAVLYEKSRSLWVPLFLHMLNNTALFLFLIFVLGMQEIMHLPAY